MWAESTDLRLNEIGSDMQYRGLEYGIRAMKITTNQRHRSCEVNGSWFSLWTLSTGRS